MAKDSFGFGTDKVSFNDPWGDNIYIPYKEKPYKKGEKIDYIYGKEADKYNHWIGKDPDSKYNDYFQGTLFRFHTRQDPDLSKVSDDDLMRLMEWYEVIGSRSDEDIQEQIFALKKLKEESNRREF